MNRTMIRTVVLALGCLALLSCRPYYSFFFNGYVYDGISGARVENYTLTVSYADQSITAKVTNGRFVAGPLPMQRDYTVRIEAEGFKPLVSQNVGFGSSQFGGASTAGPEYVYREATLFPDGAVSPAQRVRVVLVDSNAAPSGTAQLRPQGSTSSLDDAGVQIASRRWLNTETLQSATLIVTFANGVIDIPEGALTLGLSYALSIFGVAGYGLEDGVITFFAGGESDQIVQLTRIDDIGLKIVDATNRSGAAIPSGQLVITFNQDIELDPALTQASWNNLVDAAVTATLNDGATNPPLKDATGPTNERGVSVTISGNTLTFSVTPNVANILLNPIAPPAFMHLVTYPTDNANGPRIRRKGTDDAFVALNAGAIQSGAFTVSGDVIVQAR